MTQRFTLTGVNPAQRVAAQVITILQEHDILAEDLPLSPHMDLFASGLDSMGIMQLLVHLEVTFQVQLDPADVTKAHFATPLALAELLLSKSAQCP